MSKNVIKDLTITKHKTDSVRYQTIRTGEVKSRDERGKQLMRELELILKNPSEYSEEDLEIYEKRYKSLCEKYRKNTPRDFTQNHIPFTVSRGSKRYVVYIREKHLFKTKWVKLIGIKKIKQRHQEYLELLYKKPKGRVFWNPFID